MKRIMILVLAFILATPCFSRAAAKEDYEQAYKIYVAAGACMAAYSDRYGQLANKYLERDGWQIERFAHGSNGVDARFLLAKKQSDDGQQMYVLAFVGTENDKDMKANMEFSKVYFAGSNLEEFAYYAAQKGMPATAPKVHRGFHEFVQAGLAVSTQDADGKTRYLTDVLVKNSDRKILIVGHSRGGAAATLAAARLISMGVKPEQIEIITFGAPAVGNAAFAASFNTKLDLTRVVVSGDPVTGVLQTLVGGYKQFGREVLWEMPSVAHTPHEMATYADLAIKNYYKEREKATQAGLNTTPQTTIATRNSFGRVYIAPIKNDLPGYLQEEYWYIRQALLDEYRKTIPDYVIAEEIKGDQLLKEAAESGCKWVVAAAVGGYRDKTEQNVYYITFSQAAYNVETGKLVKAATFSTGTYNLTPLTAFIHATKSMVYDWMSEETLLRE